MKHILLILRFFFTLQQISYTSPGQSKRQIDERSDINFCELPNANGSGGSYRYLEDCANITNFEVLPMPAPDNDLGVHPSICCPRYGAGIIVFPTDSFSPSFIAKQHLPDYFTVYTESTEEEEEDYYYDRLSAPKVSENVCPNRFMGDASATCINFKDCEGILNEDIRRVDVCGWDESENILMVCCPQSVRLQRKKYKMVPRFNQKPETPYLCDNKADYVRNGMCEKWRNNGACEVDKHFELTDNSIDDVVTSHEMFHFMMLSCMETCRRCTEDVCQDEHPMCPTWARRNMCSLNPWFMGHTCRESCGVCGFLSPFDKTVQIIGDKTYSDIRDEKFDCGRTKLLKDILTGNNSLAVEKKQIKPKAVEYADDVFFATESQENEYSCAATIIADRWAVAAGHCYANLGESTSEEGKIVRVKVIRDYKDSRFKEHLEVKRVYIHPHYKWPNLYNDIAVVELGRRIEYDFEKFGDTPACLNNVDNIIGEIASVQGYGFDEHGNRGRLLEAGGLRIITLEECREIFRYNITDNSGYKRKLQVALPNGLNDQLLCVQGIYDEELGVFPGSCKGDSGGPLFLYPDGKQTLVGIVSGGIGCGLGIPGWYTKVSFFSRWMRCIMESSVSLNNDHDAIQKHCLRYTKDGSVDNSDWLGHKVYWFKLKN